MYYVKPKEEPEPEKVPMMTSKDMLVENPVTVVSQPSQEELAQIPVQHVGADFDMEVLKEYEGAAAEVTPNPEGGEENQRQEVVEREETLASNITSGKVKIKDVSPEDLDDFMRSSIIARPLSMPNMLDIRMKDPAYRPRWVNFKARGGARFDEAVAQGFIKVTEPREVVGLNTHLMIHKDGIKYHDVILMKIQTEKLFGAYKYNVIRSAQMVSRKGAQLIGAREAGKTLRQGISNEGFSYTTDLASKIGVYIPREDEGPNI